MPYKKMTKDNDGAIAEALSSELARQLRLYPPIEKSEIETGIKIKGTHVELPSLNLKIISDLYTHLLNNSIPDMESLGSVIAFNWFVGQGDFNLTNVAVDVNGVCYAYDFDCAFQNIQRATSFAKSREQQYVHIDFDKCKTIDAIAEAGIRTLKNSGLFAGLSCDELVKNKQLIVKGITEQIASMSHLTMKGISFLVGDHIKSNDKDKYIAYLSAKITQAQNLAQNKPEKIDIVSALTKLNEIINKEKIPAEIINKFPDVPKNIDEKFIDNLRTFIENLAQSKNISPDLSFATHQVMVALAEIQPRNIDEDNKDECTDPISFETIKKDQYVALSTGYLFDLNTAKSLLKNPVDPLSRQKLSSNDIERLKRFVDSEPLSKKTSNFKVSEMVYDKSKVQLKCTELQHELLQQKLLAITNNLQQETMANLQSLIELTKIDTSFYKQVSDALTSNNAKGQLNVELLARRYPALIPDFIILTSKNEACKTALASLMDEKGATNYKNIKSTLRTEFASLMAKNDVNTPSLKNNIEKQIALYTFKVAQSAIGTFGMFKCNKTKHKLKSLEVFKGIMEALENKNEAYDDDSLLQMLHSPELKENSELFDCAKKIVNAYRNNFEKNSEWVEVVTRNN